MSMEPKVGQWVDYPAECGWPAGRGKVEHVSNGEHMGRKFWWLLLRYEKDRNGTRRSAVWPTTRLGFPNRE